MFVLALFLFYFILVSVCMYKSQNKTEREMSDFYLNKLLFQTSCEAAVLQLEQTCAMWLGQG